MDILKAVVYPLILGISSIAFAQATEPAPKQNVIVFGQADPNKVMCLKDTSNDKTMCYKVEQVGESVPTPTQLVQSTPKPIIGKGVEQWEDLVKEYFPEDQWMNALRVMSGENGSGEPSRTHKNGNGSTDFGLFQINSVHANRVGGDLNFLLDAETNIRIAAQIWREQGWRPWVAARKLNIK